MQGSNGESGSTRTRGWLRDEFRTRPNEQRPLDRPHHPGELYRRQDGDCVIGVRRIGNSGLRRLSRARQAPVRSPERFEK